MQKGMILTNTYAELKDRQQKVFDAFPCFFAFSDAQFADGMKNLGLDPADTDMIYRGPAGMFYRKSDSERFYNMCKGFDTELKSAIAEDKTGDGFIYDMFSYELANHEYGYTQDLEETLDVLNYTIDDINADARLLNGLRKAMAQFELGGADD